MYNTGATIGVTYVLTITLLVQPLESYYTHALYRP